MNTLSPTNKIICPGCGALVENKPGKPHKYFGANQGCWDLYGEVLAKEYGEYNYPQLTHRLTVDTYAVQHPGEPGRQSIQSINVHLVSLYLILVKDYNGEKATRKIDEIINAKPKFDWLEPPKPNGNLTILDVLKAKNPEEHKKKVREWAEDVFECWYLKHKEKICNLNNKYISVI